MAMPTTAPTTEASKISGTSVEITGPQVGKIELYIIVLLSSAWNFFVELAQLFIVAVGSGQLAL